MKLYMALLFFISFGYVFGQPFKYSPANDRLEVPFEELMSAKLNGLISIQTIIDSGPDLTKLKPLGDPKEIQREEVEGVGEELDYIYADGLVLAFSSLSQPEFVLQSIVLTGDAQLHFEDGQKLTANKDLLSYVEDTVTDLIDLTERSIVPIKLNPSGGQWIKITQNRGRIEEIVLFLGYGN